MKKNIVGVAVVTDPVPICSLEKQVSCIYYYEGEPHALQRWVLIIHITNGDDVNSIQNGQ